MMQRIGLIAARDFVATVSGKAFLIGLLVMPVLILLFVVLAPRILDSHGPRVVGVIEVIDPTGEVLPHLKAALEPAAIAARRARERASVRAARPAPPNTATAPQPRGGAIPLISVIERPPTDPVPRDERWLLAPNVPGEPAGSHLALVVVEPDAVVRPSARADYGSYDLYLAPRVDEATESAIRDGMREALIAARFQRGAIDREAVESAMRIAAPTVTIVTHAGQRPERLTFARLLPFACGILLFIGIITGGQILMTSTVEEKSS
ncbi:MAG: hypothetical protein ACREUG_14690, partial [Steroidobacteraceae bacterium]